MKNIRLEETDSTNSYAKMNIDSLPDRTVVHALHQTSGRGRLNRNWVDLGEGNLFMSLILKPSDTFNEIYPNITQYLSVVLCKVLETYGVKPQIKWPNDVLIDGKKIAGILSETVISGKKLKGLVVGIGVNLNANETDVKNIPNKLATALNLECGKTIDVDTFREQLVEEFFNNYDNFLKTGFEFIKNDYIERNCFLNRELNVQIFNNIENGIAKRVSDNGALVLQTKKNDELVLTIGDIL
ncbi:MAG: biotin--[acetyl-CoA-carboxylase] ligase [Muribaculaceae bacterium]|nr:biotin--[acetyl-CoA-carboxylase] ligase [Muribaculaceae bacterium]